MATQVQVVQGSGSGTVSAQAIPAPASGFAAGNHVLFLVFWRSTGGLAGTLQAPTDTQGNTYQIDRQALSSGSDGIALVSGHITTPLVNGVDEIDLAWNNPVGARGWILEEVLGLDPASWFGASNSSALSGASPINLPSQTPPAGSYWFFGGEGDISTVSVNSVGGGFTQVGVRETEAGPTCLTAIDLQNITLDGLTAVQGSITFSGSISNARQVIGYYKLAAGDAGTARLSLTPSATEVPPSAGDVGTARLSFVPSAGEIYASTTAYPTTGILDSGGRADENPLSFSGKWARLTTNNPAMALASGVFISATNTQTGQSYWTTQFGADQEAFCTVTALPTVDGGELARVNFRRLGVGGANSANSGYRLIVNWRSASADEWKLQRFDFGTAVDLGAVPVLQNLAVGDKIGIRAVGSTLSIFYFDVSSGLWSLLFTRTDATYNTASYIGFSVGSSADVQTIDDLGGGNYVPPGGAADAATAIIKFTPSAIEGLGSFYSIAILDAHFEICGNFVGSYSYDLVIPPGPTPGGGGTTPPTPTPIVQPPYRIVHMLHDGTELGEVYPANTNFVKPLNKVGSVTYDMDLSDNLARRGNCESYATDFIIYRGDQKLMAGVHTEVGLSEVEDHTINVAGQSWEHYLEQEWPFDPNDPLANTYDAFDVDIVDVVTVLVGTLAGLPNALEINVLPIPASGQLVRFKIDVADTQQVLDMIVTLSQTNPGFDFEITPDLDFIIYPNKKGIKRELVLEQGVNTYNFGYLNKGIEATHTVGFAQSTTNRVASVADSDSQTKYRRWAKSTDFNDITDITMLDNLTKTESDRNGTAHLEITCKIIPEVGQNIWDEVDVGDTVEVKADIVYDQIDQDMRVVSLTGNVTDEGDEEIEITLDDGTLSL